MLKHSLKVGASFGTASGVITTLGLMVGLHSGTNSKLAVIGGLITIAIADSFSDALGIHIAEEAEDEHTTKQVWAATISTFLAKFIFALTFLVPVLMFDLSTAILVSVAWGLSVVTALSYVIAREQKVSPWKAIFEHLVIAILVVAITHYVGDWVALKFS